jgi:hypothetical protein
LKGSAIVPVVARTKKQEGDAIARLSDASEDALRQLAGFPHRLFVRSGDDLRHEINQIATRLRAIDPLVARVTKLEERVNALERKRAQPAKRKAPTRRKPSPPGLEVTATPPREPEPTTTPVREELAAHVPVQQPEPPTESQIA